MDPALTRAGASARRGQESPNKRSTPQKSGVCRILAPVRRFQLSARVRPRGDRTRRRRTTSRQRPSRPLSWWCRHSSGRTLESRVWRADRSSGVRLARCFDDLPTGGPVGPWPLGASTRISTVAAADWIGDLLSRATDGRGLEASGKPRERAGSVVNASGDRQRASRSIIRPSATARAARQSHIGAEVPRAEPV
jgi:hypothetical protein